MLNINEITETRRIIKEAKREGKSVGFVPTMGFLHEGHISLIRKAKEENDFVVVSIFVNPTQFGPNEDYTSYPRDFDRDAQLCEEAGTDLIFYPTPEMMYPANYSTYVNVEGLTDGLCGASRPGHFQGVATVVAKLFNIVTPDRAYFGQKDAQQVAVLERMTKDLNFDIEIVPCPIVREADGLAMSSRNTYLVGEERKAALVLSKSLNLASESIQSGERSAEKIFDQMKALIEGEPLAKIDYIEIVSAETLKPIKTIAGDVLIALAVKVGKPRLIDNMRFRGIK